MFGVEGVDFTKIHKSFHKTICCLTVEEQRTSEIKARIDLTPKHQKEEVTGGMWNLLGHQGISEWNHSFIYFRECGNNLSYKIWKE